MEVAARTLILDIPSTRPVYIPWSQINIFFDSTVVLTITPIFTPIAPAQQHIQSTFTGGNTSIVSSPPADATYQSNTTTHHILIYTWDPI